MDFSTFQLAIFDAVAKREHNIAVNAVAGSGKTTTIVEAAKKIDPTSSLFCAFNVHIREELRKRLPKEMDVTTIHAFGFKVLRSALGNTFREPDSRKYRELAKPHVFTIVKTLFPADSGDYQTKEKVSTALMTLINLTRVMMIEPSNTEAILDLASEHNFSEEVYPEVVRHYQEALTDILEKGRWQVKTDRLIDFTDMLWFPVVENLPVPKYNTVFVDEAQDLSRAQAELILRACHSKSRVIMVGDPRQAIYKFAGADSKSFPRLRDLMHAKELPLSVCYRCPKKVVELAKQDVPQIEYTESAPDGIVEYVSYARLNPMLQTNDLILCRFTAPLVKLCLSLIGDGRAAKVKGKEIGKSMAKVVRDVAKLPNFTFSEFGERLEELVAVRRMRLQSQNNADIKIEALNDMREAITVCYERFTQCTTAEDLATRIETLFDDNGGAITLSTIHRAKGLEMNRVFILGFDQLPVRRRNQSADALAQEANLRYVAITRAKQELYLVQGTGSSPVVK